MLRLKYLRESERLSQKEMGEKLDISTSNVSKYELGLLEPNLTVIKKYAAYFNVSIDFILGITNNPARKQSEADESDESFIYILGDNGIGDKIEIPSDKIERFKMLMEAGLPEIFDGKKNK